MGSSRRGAAALGVLALAAACSGGAAAHIDGALSPAPDAAIADAVVDEIPDAGIPDAGMPDASGASDAGPGDGGTGATDGGAADGPIVPIAVTGELAGIWDGASITVRLQGTGVDDQLVTLDANGAFAFAVELPEGTPFVAAIESGPALHTCAVHNQRGP